MKARAVVFPEAGKVELREVTLREPAPDEVVVETGYSSISSGTERLLFLGKLPAIPHLRYPLIPGYEAAGTVVSVGSDVTNIKAGDRVFVGGSFCYADVGAAFGGQSSLLIKNASQVVPLERIPLAHAPLLALAATARHGVARLGDVNRARVAIFGAGAVGQLAAGFLAIAGAHPVLIDRSPERLAQTSGFETVDVSVTPLEEQCVEPVRHSIEATGDSAQIPRCARLTEAGGSIVLLSYYDTLTTPFVDLFLKESTLLVSREWAHTDLLAARDAASNGKLDLQPLASHIVPIDRYDDAYDRAFNDSSILKVVLQWA